MLTRLGALAVALISLPVGAQPAKQPPPLVGATEVQSFGASTGFVEDAIGYDDQRIAYVVADGSTKTELHIAQPNVAEVVIDLSAITLHPISVKLLGPRVFVVGLDANNEQTGAMLEKSKVIWKVGPATHITVLDKKLALDHLTGSRREVELASLDTGKRIAAGHAFELDATGTNKALDFHVNHWSDGWTKAYGIKGGEWDRKENQRTADVEATYDVVAGKFIDRHPIQELFEQRKRYQVLADADGSLDFVRMSWDNTSVVAWRGGKPQTLETDQPLSQYDPKSLQGNLQGDTTWIGLEVDPVNADAVARKKADPKYFDIFKAGSDGKAIRKMRVLEATGVHYRFGVIHDKVWLLERSPGFDRGGKALTFYTIN